MLYKYTYIYLYLCVCVCVFVCVCVCTIMKTMCPSCYHICTSCTQVHELPQSHCGDKREGTLFS